MTIAEQLRVTSEGQVQHGMTIGPVFPTILALVLHHGRSYTRTPLPKGHWSGACFANVLRVAMTGRWVYVEGFAAAKSGALPILHAWVTDPNNPSVAYDPTWKTGAEYIGISFQLAYVLHTYRRAGRPGVLDTWELGWPLLSGENRGRPFQVTIIRRFWVTAEGASRRKSGRR